MADFTWIPYYTLPRRFRWVTRISEGETGKEILRSKRTNPVVGFGLNFSGANALTVSQADAMLSFYNTKKGAGAWFTWEHPQSLVVYTVRFADDEIEQGYFMFGRYNCTVNFRVKIT